MKHLVLMIFVLCGTCQCFGQIKNIDQQFKPNNLSKVLANGKHEQYTNKPKIISRLTDKFPLEMPELYTYPIYINCEIDSPLTITKVEVEIEGKKFPTVSKNNYFLCWWKPEKYDDFEIVFKATGSDGSTNTKKISVTVSNSIKSVNVKAFDADLINYEDSEESRWHYGAYQLPQSIGAYNKIIANFSVKCPSISGGCDDWDRVAWVEYKAPDGNWMELFRYITPYGVACDHSIDVTDYASLLQGNLEIRMFIDTWGTGGWELYLDFDYVKGEPKYLYSTVQEIWHGRFDFGNPSNLQPMDTVTVGFPKNTQKATFRVTTTGHGWGPNNTSNAAEFYKATHNFHVNGSPTYKQVLWNKCNPNPDNCTGQKGTWRGNRAGWCPGTIAPPNIYDFTPHISSEKIDLSYIFQKNYKDLCNPNNPDCKSGSTCSDCDADYNPHYEIGAYVISFSDSVITQIPKKSKVNNLKVYAYPNPSGENFKIKVNQYFKNIEIAVRDVSGRILKSYYFKNSINLSNHNFNFSDFASNGNVYFLSISTSQEQKTIRIIKL